MSREAAYIVSSVLYIFGIAAAAVIAFRPTHHQGRDKRWNTRPYKGDPKAKWILLFVLASFILRICWFVSKVSNEDTGFIRWIQFIINRLSLLSLFAAFALVLFGWSSLSALVKGKTPFSRRAFLLVGGVVVGAQVVATIMAIFDKSILEKNTQNLWYHADMLALIIPLFLMSMAFSYYSSFFASMLPSFLSQAGRRTLSRLRIITNACTVFFLLRCIMFIYGLFYNALRLDSKIAFLRSLDEILYPWFYYTLPDLIPGLGLLLIIAPSQETTSVENDPSSRAESGVGTMDENGGTFAEPTNVNSTFSLNHSDSALSTITRHNSSTNLGRRGSYDREPTLQLHNSRPHPSQQRQITVSPFMQNPPRPHFQHQNSPASSSRPSEMGLGLGGGAAGGGGSGIGVVGVVGGGSLRGTAVYRPPAVGGNDDEYFKDAMNSYSQAQLRVGGTDSDSPYPSYRGTPVQGNSRNNSTFGSPAGMPRQSSNEGSNNNSGGNSGNVSGNVSGIDNIRHGSTSEKANTFTRPLLADR